MARKVEENARIDNARILFRNFAGEERAPFNKAGDRNFCVVLEPEVAEGMANAGWNVKTTTPREEGDAPLHYIQAAVSYKNRPPNIYMLTRNGRTRLDEDTVVVLDYADIAKVDVILNPYNWEVPGSGSGVKAYVKTMFVDLVEDELEKKYADIPIINSREPIQITDGTNDIVEVGEIVSEAAPWEE